MHQKVELKRAIDKRKLIEEEALQVLNFSSSRLNNAPDDVIETEGVELIEKKEILLPTNPTADFSALIVGSGEQGPEDHSNYLMDFEPDESNGDLVVPPSSNVPISPSEAIEVGCLRASSALRRTTSSSSSRYIRGGSLSNIMVAVVEGNPRPPRTPKLRSRVGDGIEPNFLEVFDENDLPPRID